MKAYLKYILLIFAIGGLVGFYMYNKPHKNMTSAEIDVKMNAPQLFEHFEKDESLANQKYLDKVIEVSGLVTAVNVEKDGTTSVTLDTDNSMFGIICQMDNLSKHKRTNFKTGEQVKLKGICTGMLMDVILVRCVEV